MEVMNGSVTGSDPSSRGRHHGSCLPRELAGEISRERSPRLIHHPVRRTPHPRRLAHTSTLSSVFHPLFPIPILSHPFVFLAFPRPAGISRVVKSQENPTRSRADRVFLFPSELKISGSYAMKNKGKNISRFVIFRPIFLRRRDGCRLLDFGR